MFTGPFFFFFFLFFVQNFVDLGSQAQIARLVTSFRSRLVVMFGASQSCYHLAATALGRSALWQQGVRLTQMAAADGVPLSPNTFTSVLGACAKKARWVEALEVLEEARPTLRRQNARSTTASSSPSSPRGQNETGSGSKTLPGTAPENVPTTARAESATGRDRTGRRVSVGPKPGHVDYVVPAYTLAMVACREAGKNVEALQVLRIADEDGVRGDPSLFRLALKCCAKIGAIDREDEREALGRWAGPNGAAIGDKIVEEITAFGLRLGVEDITDLTQVRRGCRSTFLSNLERMGGFTSWTLINLKASSG